MDRKLIKLQGQADQSEMMQVNAMYVVGSCSEKVLLEILIWFIITHLQNEIRKKKDCERKLT